MVCIVLRSGHDPVAGSGFGHYKESQRSWTGSGVPSSRFIRESRVRIMPLLLSLPFVFGRTTV